MRSNVTPVCTARGTGVHHSEKARNRCPKCNPHRPQMWGNLGDGSVPTWSYDYPGSLKSPDRTMSGEQAMIDVIETASNSSDLTALARNTKATALVMEMLFDRAVRDQNLPLMRHIAANPRATTKILNALAQRPEPEFAMGIAKNKNSSPELLAAIAAYPHEEVRRYVAKNPSTPVPVLFELLLDDETIVRRGAAGNPSLPLWAAEDLAKHELAVIRREAAKRPLSSETMRALARDDANSVRAAVIANRKASLSALYILTKSAGYTEKRDAPAAFRKRLHTATGIQTGNQQAIAMVVDSVDMNDLDDLDSIGPEHPIVVLALAMHPNR